MTKAPSELLPVWWTVTLAHGGDPLELHRAAIADGRVATSWIVEPFDVIEHVGTGLVPGAITSCGRCVRFFSEEKKLSMAALFPDIAGSASCCRPTPW